MIKGLLDDKKQQTDLIKELNTDLKRREETFLK